MPEQFDLNAILQPLLSSIIGQGIQGGSSFLTNTLLNQIDPGRPARFEQLPTSPLGVRQGALADRLKELESVFAQVRPTSGTPSAGTPFQFNFNPISKQNPNITAAPQTNPQDTIQSILEGIVPGLTRTFQNRREDILANFAAAGVGRGGDIAQRLLEAERDLIFNPAAEAAARGFESARQFNMTDFLQRLGLAQTGELAGAQGGLQAQQATEQSRQFNADNIIKSLQASLLPQTILAAMKPEERDILGFPAEPSLSQQTAQQRQMTDLLSLFTGRGGGGVGGVLGNVGGGVLGGAIGGAGGSLGGAAGGAIASALLGALGLGAAAKGTAGGASVETIVNQVLGQPTGPSLIDPTLSLSPLINDPAKLIPGQGTPVDAYGLLQQILTEQESNSLIPGLLGVSVEVTPAASSFLVGLEGLGTSGPTAAAAPAASAASAPSSFLTTLGDIGGGLAGNFAAQALLGGDRSKQQAITGGIGGALGGLLGQALIPVPVLGAGVGSFLGNALAGIFGPDAGDPWDHANNAPTISGNILTAVHGWQTAAGMPNSTKEFPDVAQRLINEAFANLGSDDVGRFEELQKSGWLEG